VEARVLNADPPVQHVVLDASGITDIDLTAVESLQGLARTLAERRVDLRIGGAIGGLRDLLERGGVMAAVGGKFYRTVDEAVRAGLPPPGS
jgi:MFS superfamily sulfate permease-like transporter